MTDRIVLHNMVFQGRHGVLEQEQHEAQPFQVDVELVYPLKDAEIVVPTLHATSRNGHPTLPLHSAAAFFGRHCPLRVR